jgi:hypothetical protein
MSAKIANQVSNALETRGFQIAASDAGHLTAKRSGETFDVGVEGKTLFARAVVDNYVGDEPRAAAQVLTASQDVTEALERVLTRAAQKAGRPSWPLQLDTLVPPGFKLLPRRTKFALYYNSELKVPRYFEFSRRGDCLRLNVGVFVDGLASQAKPTHPLIEVYFKQSPTPEELKPIIEMLSKESMPFAQLKRYIYEERGFGATRDGFLIEARPSIIERILRLAPSRVRQLTQHIPHFDVPADE